jgi:hypothetical protein
LLDARRRWLIRAQPREAKFITGVLLPVDGGQSAKIG